MSDQEILLSGGNVNGAVVRVGGTVRRAQTPASPTVHRLLLHLEAKGFAAGPRFLGIDGRQREILSFLEGETGIPSAIWQGDEALIATARLLRAYHDATLDFVPPEPAAWAYRYPDATRHEVICHNDFAPYNFVYTGGVPTGVIDFDLAGPGPRLRDVAYAAYWLVPLSFHSADQKAFAEADLQNGSRRLRLFCTTYGIGYGIGAGRELLEMVAEVLALMGDEEEMRAIVGEATAARLKAEGHLAYWQEEAGAFQERRARLEANVRG